MSAPTFRRHFSLFGVVRRWEGRHWGFSGNGWWQERGEKCRDGVDGAGLAV